MRWRDDWPPSQWDKPPSPNAPGGTPTGVFNATFRTKYTAGIMGIGGEYPHSSGNLPLGIRSRRLPKLGQHSPSCCFSSRPTTTKRAQLTSLYLASLNACWFTGDTTANLWWRIINGELPLATPPKVAVILIGTNDVGATESCLRDGDADLETAAGTNSRSLSLSLNCVL